MKVMFVALLLTILTSLSYQTVRINTSTWVPYMDTGAVVISYNKSSLSIINAQDGVSYTVGELRYHDKSTGKYTYRRVAIDINNAAIKSLKKCESAGTLVQCRDDVTAFVNVSENSYTYLLMREMVNKSK